MEQVPTVVIEDARIVFSNFAGREGRFNREGERDFSVAIPEDLAQQMLIDGWNIKYLKPREEDDIPTAILPVRVRFDKRPPNVVLISSSARTKLGEDTIDILDWANIQMVDLVVRARYWEDDNGQRKIKAYLKSLFVTIDEDELEKKYGYYDDMAAEQED